MIDDRMYDLAIKPLQNGGFELEQGIGSGETVLIDLHLLQIRWLAERAGLLPQPDPTLLDRLSARHVGRLRALCERLDEIRHFYLDKIIDRCGSGIEFLLHLRALEDLADEMIADVGNNADSVTPALPTPSNEKSTLIPVTPEISKRGRPASGEALTNAERQARHREKQSALPLQPAAAGAGTVEREPAGEEA